MTSHVCSQRDGCTRKKHIFIFRGTDRGMSEIRKEEKVGTVEITEGRGGARDYSWCLKRSNKREEGPLCPSFFLPASSRDDGVCPRGRSILLESRGSRASLAAGEEKEKERKSEPKSGVYRGAPGGTRGPLATGTLNVGGTAEAPPGCFSPAYLTYVPATFSPSLSFYSSRPLPLPFGFLILPLLLSLHLLFGSSSPSFFLRNYLTRSCLYKIRILDRRIMLLSLDSRIL